MNKNTLLINKYKPTRFDDFFAGDPPDTSLLPSASASASILPFLKKQIEKNKILTLIVGEEETGKTTMLNTIIREYYGSSTTATYRSNVLYIHYLKEQGTSYYKNEVKYFCQTYCSIPGRKKTIVLDDLDFMTESNQTIFIGIIDKYSKYVNFISSCRLLHKILYGIQTRLMIVRLHRLSVPRLLFIANRILAEEGLMAEPAAVESLVAVSKNKINRLINCIDKIKLFTDAVRGTAGADKTLVSKEMVYQICANIQYSIYKKYFMLVLEQRLKEAIDILYELHDKGFSVIDILDNMFEYTKLVANESDIDVYPLDEVFILPITKIKVYEVVKVICKYITFFYNVHEDEIELALLTNEIISTICIYCT